jgi:hypothetical protein
MAKGVQPGEELKKRLPAYGGSAASILRSLSIPLNTPS